MSKKTKQNTRDRRRNEKRGRKQAEVAKYAAFAARGENSKRGNKRAKASKDINLKAHSHADGPCTNFGCKICFTELNMKPIPGTFQYSILKLLYPNSRLLLS